MDGHILSASNLPTYDVELTFYRAGPEHLFEDGWNIQKIKVLPPHEGDIAIPLPAELAKSLPLDRRQNALDVSIKFRDSSGRHWLRDPFGFLIDATQPTVSLWWTAALGHPPAGPAGSSRWAQR